METVGGRMAVSAAQRVEGLRVADDGEILGLGRDGKAILADLLDAYIDLGGTVSASLIARAIENQGGATVDLPQQLAKRIDTRPS